MITAFKLGIYGLTTKALSFIADVPQKWIENNFKQLGITQVKRKGIKLPSFRKVDTLKKVRLLLRLPTSDSLSEAEIKRTLGLPLYHTIFVRDNSKYCYFLLPPKAQYIVQTDKTFNYLVWQLNYKVLKIWKNSPKFMMESYRTILPLFTKVMIRLFLLFYLNSAQTTKTWLLQSIRILSNINSLLQPENILTNQIDKEIIERYKAQDTRSLEKNSEMKLESKQTYLQLNFSLLAAKRLEKKIIEEAQFVEY